jgi:ribosomal protein L24E
LSSFKTGGFSRVHIHRVRSTERGTTKMYVQNIGAILIMKSDVTEKETEI